jgi:hypothetical protein
LPPAERHLVVVARSLDTGNRTLAAIHCVAVKANVGIVDDRLETMQCGTQVAHGEK